MSMITITATPAIPMPPHNITTIEGLPEVGCA